MLSRPHRTPRCLAVTITCLALASSCLWPTATAQAGRPLDSDGDGVINEEDACPRSDISELLAFKKCGIGIPNHLFKDGCSLADRVRLCEELPSTEEAGACIVETISEQLEDADKETLVELQECFGPVEPPPPVEMHYDRRVESFFLRPGSGPGLCDVHVRVAFDIRDQAGQWLDLGVQVNLFDGADRILHQSIDALFPPTFGVTCAGPGCSGEAGIVFAHGGVQQDLSCGPADNFICARQVRCEVVFQDVAFGADPGVRLVPMLGTPAEVFLANDSSVIAPDCPQPGEVPDEAPQEAEGLQRFVRGDCDGDGSACSGINDAAVLLGWLFAGAAEPVCLAACDSNGSGTPDMTDVIFGLSYCFVGTEPPVSPFPECGPGESDGDQALGCGQSPQTCQ